MLSDKSVLQRGKSFGSFDKVRVGGSGDDGQAGSSSSPQSQNLQKLAKLRPMVGKTEAVA